MGGIINQLITGDFFPKKIASLDYSSNFTRAYDTAERHRSPLEILLEMFLLKQGLSLFEMRILPISIFL